MTHISFIIRFHNEARYIGECIDAVARQHGDFKKQVVFVNSHSSDSSREIIAEFSQHNPDISIKIIDLGKQFTFSSAINAALPYLEGQYTVILSAHATLGTDDWLIKTIKNFNDEKVAICYGRLIVRADANTQSLMTSLTVSVPYKIIKSKEYFFRKDDMTNAFAFLNLNTCNVIRTDLLKQYKFKELPSVEDMELGKRLLEDGYKIIYEPEAVVWHSHNDSMQKMVARWINAAVGISLIFKNKVPGKIALIKSTVPSFVIFMLKVSLRERNLFKKIGYMWRGLSGSVALISKIIGNYQEIKKWEGMYANS